MAGDERDIVEIGVERDGGDGVTPVNILRDDIDNDTIALHVHDDVETPKESTLGELPAFASNPLLRPFQGSVDLFMPAADPPDGTITVKNIPRGDGKKPQVINFPNWSSDKHFINLMFSDFAQPE